MRDGQGRIINSSSKKPSAARLKTMLRQAERQGATRAGIIADVGKFQGYEQTQAGQHLIRAFRRKEDAATPGALRDRLEKSSQPVDAFLLNEIKQATGAEQAEDLRGVTINFYYG